MLVSPVQYGERNPVILLCPSAASQETVFVLFSSLRFHSRVKGKEEDRRESYTIMLSKRLKYQ